MTNVTNTLDTIAAEHAIALKWFGDHAGEVVPWSAIQDHTAHRARLVTQAKGIYKPHYTDYALSVRQTLDSPYADKEVVLRLDGSWVYPYYQENPNPAHRDREATNRGLMKCMEDDVPVGVLLQVKPKPGVEYQVLGLARVSDWSNGYFILEGLPRQPEGSETPTNYQGAPHHDRDAAYDRARAATTASAIDDFNLDAEDSRERQIAEVVRRRGQRRFRAALLKAYQGKCALTGCDAVDALEAAHVSPYRGAQSNHIQNGLLLRADIHSLFDLGLLSFDPETRMARLASQLADTTYAALAGRTLSEPSNPKLKPNTAALSEHLKWTGIEEQRKT